MYRWTVVMETPAAGLGLLISELYVLLLRHYLGQKDLRALQVWEPTFILPAGKNKMVTGSLLRPQPIFIMTLGRVPTTLQKHTALPMSGFGRLRSD